MKVRVRYFASLREALGAEEQIELPAGCTVGEARALLIARSAAHAQALRAERVLRAALDQQLADSTTPIRDGAELAFFPPVTGG
jgi:molybdopterin synthase sulfur carrier subunit